MPYWMKRLSSVHFGETLARELQKLEDGAPDFTLWQETSNLVKLHIPVISVHFITNAAKTRTCDVILDEETLFGAFWRAFSKIFAKARRRSTFFDPMARNIKFGEATHSCHLSSFHHKCCNPKHMRCHTG